MYTHLKFKFSEKRIKKSELIPGFLISQQKVFKGWKERNVFHWSWKLVTAQKQRRVSSTLRRRRRHSLTCSEVKTTETRDSLSWSRRIFWGENGWSPIKKKAALLSCRNGYPSLLIVNGQNHLRKASGASWVLVEFWFWNVKTVLCRKKVALKITLSLVLFTLQCFPVVYTVTCIVYLYTVIRLIL